MYIELKNMHEVDLLTCKRVENIQPERFVSVLGYDSEFTDTLDEHQQTNRQKKRTFILPMIAGILLFFFRCERCLVFSSYIHLGI